MDYFKFASHNARLQSDSFKYAQGRARAYREGRLVAMFGRTYEVPVEKRCTKCQHVYDILGMTEQPEGDHLCFSCEEEMVKQSEGDVYREEDRVSAESESNQYGGYSYDDM